MVINRIEEQVNTLLGTSYSPTVIANVNHFFTAAAMAVASDFGPMNFMAPWVALAECAAWELYGMAQKISRGTPVATAVSYDYRQFVEFDRAGIEFGSLCRKIAARDGWTPSSPPPESP